VKALVVVAGLIDVITLLVGEVALDKQLAVEIVIP
jgi:hypothetical protein